MLKTVESRLALYVKKTASGASTTVDMLRPNHTVQLSSRAIRMPVISSR